MYTFSLVYIYNLNTSTIWKLLFSMNDVNLSVDMDQYYSVPENQVGALS